MAKLLVRVVPNKTIQELQNEFAASQASKLTGHLEQSDAQNVALTYQTLYGGVWDVLSQGGKWVVKRR